MSIKYKVGCLLEAIEYGDLGAAAQQCNAHNRMGRGIAPLLASRWRSIREVDDLISEAKRPEEKMGRYSKTTLLGSVEFYNLYGQLHSNFKVEEGRNTDYIALANAMQRMREDLDSVYWSPCTIGFPLIGCGLAGGDWGIVSKLIHDVFVTKGYKVVIYVLTEEEKLKHE